MRYRTILYSYSDSCLRYAILASAGGRPVHVRSGRAARSSIADHPRSIRIPWRICYFRSPCASARARRVNVGESGTVNRTPKGAPERKYSESICDNALF